MAFWSLLAGMVNYSSTLKRYIPCYFIPIARQNHLAKIDDNRVMGIMDLKGSLEPYIFILARDGDYSDMPKSRKGP
jgi:hypothetical protein